jgi:hypothetical protein
MLTVNPATLSIGQLAKVKAVGEQPLDGVFAERVAAPGTCGAITYGIEFHCDLTSGGAMGAPLEGVHEPRMIRRRAHDAISASE